MPIQKGAGTVTPPPPPPPEKTVVPPLGIWVPTWLAPDGTVLDLNAADAKNWWTLDSVTGLGIAPVSIVSDDDPAGGVIVRAVQPRPRNITWPIRMMGVDHMAFLANWRHVAGKLAQTRRLGPGRLRIARPDGTAREIFAYYQTGFDGEPGQVWWYDTDAVSLFCPDPFWQAVDPITYERESSAPVDFLDPYPSVSSGQVIGEPTMMLNPGDAEAWPTWVITGPMDSITASNNTLGMSFTLTFELDPGEQIRMTTRPLDVVGPAGENLAGALDWPDADPWYLDPGLNEVEFVVAGADPDTRVVLSFHPRYETA